AALVPEIFQQNRNRDVSLGSIKADARQHLGNVPAQFLLGAGSRQLEKPRPEREEPIRSADRNLLSSIGAAHPEHLVLALHSVYQNRELLRMVEHEWYNRTDPADGSPVATRKN